jgi:hypothetical protein
MALLRLIDQDWHCTQALYWAVVKQETVLFPFVTAAAAAHDPTLGARGPDYNCASPPISLSP